MTLAIDKTVMNRILDERAATRALAIMTVVLVAVTAVVTLYFIRQPLLERHAFRQTQTALTVYWMLREGIQWPYQTPVAGAPWAIPFEFPIYQLIVAALVKSTGLALDAAGRLISYLFLLACCLPAFQIARRLGMGMQAPWIFCCLLLTSPAYLFWGRAFMIETAALYFIFAALPYAIDIVNQKQQWRAALLCALLASLAMLQKATTGGPVILVLGCWWLWLWYINGVWRHSFIRPLIYPAIAFGVPVLLALVWTAYTDIVKMANPFGAQLTSASLRDWNIGTSAQRFSLSTYEIFFQRAVRSNLATLLGFALVGAAVWQRRDLGLRRCCLVAVALYVLPLFLFVNLHVQHDYYQTANLLFAIGGVALAVTFWAPKMFRSPNGVVKLTALFVSINLIQFAITYGKVVRRDFNTDNQTVLAVADRLLKETPAASAFVAFGCEWSSEIGYYAQRKSFTVPRSFLRYGDVWDRPEKYLGGLPLGAIVICGANSGISEGQIALFTAKHSDWHIEGVQECRVLMKNNG